MHEVYELTETLDVDKTMERAQKMAERSRKMGLSGGYTVSLGTAKRDNGTVYHTLIIDGEAPQYGGWTFVALVDRVGDGAVITGVPGYEGAPVDRAWAEQQTCDHCRTDRYRTHTVVVEHPQKGRKRVGSTCVKDFLGWNFRVSFIPDFSEFISEGGHSFIGYEADALLAHAHSVIRQAGWVSASNFGYGVTPTAYVVGSAWGGVKERAEYVKEFGYPTEADWAAAKACGQWIASIDPYTESEYLANLHRAFRAEYVSIRHQSLVVSGMATYLKAESRRVEREAREAAGKALTNELFAPEGTKITVDVTVTRVTAYDGHYGVTYFNKFESATHRFEWATKKALEVGAHLTITGTVKGEKEWKGQVSTDLTRCKVTERKSK